MVTTKKIVSCIDIPFEIVKEVFCRVGMDWFSNKLFIGELKGIDSEIAYAAAKKIGLYPQDLHGATCVFKKCKEKNRRNWLNKNP